MIHEFDREQGYKCVAITDLSGHSKSEHPFYRDYMGSVANNLHFDENSYGRLLMCFVENRNGQWMNQHLHTSTVREFAEDGDRLEVTTQNTIYIFEKCNVREPEYLEESNLLELFLSLDDRSYFSRGFYYDENGKPHEVSYRQHVSMTVDSVLLSVDDMERGGQFIARYFMYPHAVEFYESLYSHKNKRPLLLIHNTGRHPLKVKVGKERWTIQPGEQQRLIPDEHDKEVNDDIYE